MPRNDGERSVWLYAIGDVCVNRKQPESIFALTAPVIRQADISFCQLETMFSHRGAPLPQARLPFRSDPANATALKYAGFTIASLAGNHCLDWGADALLDTVDVLQQLGVHSVGVGKNIAEARKPVIIERKGTRVAFLAYNSILPIGYWATTDRAGCAPLRAYTLLEQFEPYQPGTHPCRIHTFANREDLEAMTEDIKKVRPLADVVVVSLHWGVHFVPGKLADYQREAGHAAIDAGADLILGHHAHILKGIEVYHGKVIFYSLCNFAFEHEAPVDYNKRAWHKDVHLALNPNWEYDPEYLLYPFPVESRKTILAKCLISDKRIQKVSFLPAYINKQAQPEILSRQDARASDVYAYMQQLCSELGTKLSWEGDDVVIATT